MGLIPALLGPIWDSGPGPGVKSRNTERLFHLCFLNREAVAPSMLRTVGLPLVLGEAPGPQNLTRNQKISTLPRIKSLCIT